MFVSHCLFCGHDNPAGAKFCNNCAEPLRLKPCERCDAINDASATNCRECGAEFPAPLSSTDAVSSDWLATEAPRASSASGYGDIERREAPLPERATDSLNVLKRQSDDEFPGARAHDVEVVAREPRRLTGGVTPLFFAEQRAAHVIPMPHFATIAQRSRIARVSLPTLLVAALALSGYYAYRSPPSNLSDSSSDIRTPSSVAPAKTGIPGTASLGTVALPAEAVSRPVLPASEVTGSPATQGKIRTSGSKNVGADTLAPSQASVAAVPQSSDTVGEGLRPAKPPAAAPQQNATQPAGQRLNSKPMSSNRSTSAYPGPVAGVLMRPRSADSTARTAPDASRARACTEAVAALGLCNVDPKGEQAK